MACRVSAILGGEEEKEELVWMRWWWEMLSAGMRCDPKTAVGCGTFGHPNGERGKPGWMTPSLGREEGSWPFVSCFHTR